MAHPRTSAGFAVLTLVRPKQWTKNVLVFAAPAAAGVLDEPAQLARTLVAFVVFCLAASGTYCLNDASDVERDRRHPTKRTRPVAAGRVSVSSARTIGVVLLVAALLTSATVGSWQLPLATASYIALTTAYTVWLKHVAVLDVAAVAAGFVVRALAGAAATHVEASKWFLIVASFGSLFMVSGKRWVEQSSDTGASGQREVLADYPPEFLVYLRSMSSSVTLVAYTLFAFDRASLASSSVPWFELSIVPFVLAVLRYALRLEQGEGGAPEDLVLSDRTLQVLGLIWLALFLTGVYAE